MLVILPTAHIETYLLEKVRRLFEPMRRPRSVGNAETLHQMRVASRRLRVGLRCFAGLFPERELEQVLRLMRRTTRAFGAIRTLDVNVQLLRRAPASPTRTQLIRSLLAERDGLVGELREWINTLRENHVELRVRTLVLKLRDDTPKRVLKDANAHIDNLRRALRRRYREFRRKPEPQAFHQMRIAAKRYRYGLEATEAIFAVKVGARIRAVERLQDLMGACHDLEVLVERLKKSDKTLAGDLAEMVEFFQKMRDDRFGEFEQSLHDDRAWMKKVRLQLPHDEQPRLSRPAHRR